MLTLDSIFECYFPFILVMFPLRTLFLSHLSRLRWNSAWICPKAIAELLIDGAEK